MQDTEKVYEDIRYILGRLWANAMLAKKERDEAVEPEERNFLDGVLQGYTEVFETLESEVKNEEIEPEKIDFYYDLATLQ